MGICWEHENRSGFPGARPPAHVPAGLGLTIVGLFEAVFPDNGLRNAETFQTLLHVPDRTGDLLVPVMIRSLACRRPSLRFQIRTDGEARFGASRVRVSQRPAVSGVVRAVEGVRGLTEVAPPKSLGLWEHWTGRRRPCVAHAS